MKTNKEIIDALVVYLMTQDPKVVARLLANSMIDIHRMYHFQNLPGNEQKTLMFRINKNCEALEKFIKDGPNGNLTFAKVESVNDN